MTDVRKGAPPSTSPPNYGDITGLLNTTFTKLMQGINGMLPAQVIAFDRATNRVSVQPLITVLNTNLQQIPRASIASIPVFNVGGGGFIMSFNLNPGDLGWIIANDRDISLFLQNYKQARPNTYRVKDFSDSIFLPNPMTGYSIASEDSPNAVLQSLDGSVKISLGSDTITVTAPNVVVNSMNATITADNVVLDGDTHFTGDVLIEGTLDVSGATTLSSTLDVTGLVELGVGGLPIARVGDSVNLTTGLITTGGLNKSL